MITDERFTAYINSLENGNPAYLDELEAYAKQTQVPIIRKEMQSFMRTLLIMNKPKRILEVGTAIGFSALFMSEFMPEGGHITTIEKYEKRIPLAKENFRKNGKEASITLLEGDATEILKELQEPFDFIFMDAAKGQYIHFLPDVLRLLNPGGILLSDNVLQDGDIIESKFAENYVSEIIDLCECIIKTYTVLMEGDYENAELMFTHVERLYDHVNLFIMCKDAKISECYQNALPHEKEYVEAAIIESHFQKFKELSSKILTKNTVFNFTFENLDNLEYI